MPTERALAPIAAPGTALVIGLVVACAAGCSGGDDTCGPGDAPSTGVTLTIASEVVDLGPFSSSPNNDCTLGDVTSLTIEAESADGGLFVLCLPAPDRIGADPVDLTDADRIQVIDLFAAAGGCQLALDRDRAASGSATFSGFCDDGTAASGYGLEFSATLPLIRTCGEVGDPVEAALAGAIAVEAN